MPRRPEPEYEIEITMMDGESHSLFTSDSMDDIRAALQPWAQAVANIESNRVLSLDFSDDFYMVRADQIKSIRVEQTNQEYQE